MEWILLIALLIGLDKYIKYRKRIAQEDKRLKEAIITYLEKNPNSEDKFILGEGLRQALTRKNGL